MVNRFTETHIVQAYLSGAVSRRSAMAALGITDLLAFHRYLAGVSVPAAPDVAALTGRLSEALDV